MNTSRKTSGELSVASAIRAAGDETRWRILNALYDCEAMASVDLAKKVGVAATNLAKHMEVLRKIGVVEQRIGRAYSLKAQYKVQDERAIDIGSMVLRLDRIEKK